MRVSKSVKKRHDLFTKIRKTLGKWCNKIAETLAKPIDAFDRWYDRYERGYEDGVLDCAKYTAQQTSKVKEARRDKANIIGERCLYIENVLDGMMIQCPELHEEADKINRALRTIKVQVR